MAEKRGDITQDERFKERLTDEGDVSTHIRTIRMLASKDQGDAYAEPEVVIDIITLFIVIKIRI